MKWSVLALGCGLVGGQVAVSAKPDSAKARAKAPVPRWRVVKAETYTFRDQWNDGRIMRAVRIWIESPGYLPTIGAVIPEGADQPAHWQLTDEQGKAYVKNYDSLEMLDYEKRKSRKVHGLEFTARYLPIPKAKVGHIRLRFPLELGKMTDEDDGEDVVVQVDTPVTHHK